MKLTLIDHDGDVADALRHAFARCPEVTVLHGDLLSVAENTVVSPANAEGLMDGGIDAAYSAALPNIERTVRDAILERPEGLLPLGAAVLVPVVHPRIKYMIAATTMVSPGAVEKRNAYRAMRAVLRIAESAKDRVTSVFCPGLCTGIGMVGAREAAEEMVAGYGDWRESASRTGA